MELVLITQNRILLLSVRGDLTQIILGLFIRLFSFIHFRLAHLTLSNPIAFGIS